MVYLQLKEMGDPINITVYEGKNIKKVVIKKGLCHYLTMRLKIAKS